MPIYGYKALARDGQRIAGEIDAADRLSALAEIERLGYTPVTVSDRGTTAVGGSRERFRLTLSRKQRMRPRDVLLFSTELADLLAAGMTLGAALNCLGGRGADDITACVARDLRDRIVRGVSLSDALAAHPDSFPSLYVNMVRAGEAGGVVEDVLRGLVEHYERFQDLKERVTMALVYPCIVLVLGLATMVFSLVYVVPQFQEIFDRMGSTLPLPTQILIDTSVWLKRYGGFLAIGILLLGILLKRMVESDSGRMRWDGLKLKFPLVRGIVASGTFAGLARTLQTLLSNGVPVLQALRVTEQTLGNRVIGEELRRARERVTDGTTISGPLAAGNVFPTLMTDMLAIGERTGDMAGALGHIGRRYENDLNRHIKIFTTALEPILIVLVAIMVGFVAVSVLMAVFRITSGLEIG